MKKRFWVIVVACLLISGLACSMSDIENVSDVGISVCSYKNNEKVITCQSAKADITTPSETQFNVGNQDTPAETTSASVTFHVTVEGQGEVKVSFKDAGGQTVSINATKDQPGELTADVPLTRKTVREAPEATRTGMDMESVFFIVKVEVVGGEKAEGVQINADVLGVR
jgi:hypothetical protein